jgi:hypothetical protein
MYSEKKKKEEVDTGQEGRILDAAPFVLISPDLRATCQLRNAIAGPRFRREPKDGEAVTTHYLGSYVN